MEPIAHCYKILKDIGKIRKNLQKDHLENLVHSVVTMRLDYCNSLLINMSKENLCCNLTTAANE